MVLRLPVGSRWSVVLTGRGVAGFVTLLAIVPVLLVVLPASAATLLFPNLKTMPPRDLRFATATISGATHDVLEFSNTAYNTGPGRLDITGQIDPTTLSGPAIQNVYDDTGHVGASYNVGTLYYHAAHQHYHYDGWGLYQLWTQTDYDKWIASGRTQGQAKLVGSKTTSCVEDEEFVQKLAGMPYPGPYTSSGCLPDSNNTLHEGLSVGWGDTYDWYRSEQWIDLGSAPTSLADGTYVLRSVADPNNQIYESPGKTDTSVESQADNEGTTTFTVSGGALLDSNPPTGTVWMNDIATSTNSPTVTAKVIGRDDVSGVDKFRLSNDGSHWAEFNYTTSGSTPTAVSWDLSNATYGGTSTSGTKTIYAQFHDVAGHWGPSTTDSINYTGGSAQPPSSAYGQAVFGDGPTAYWRVDETSGGTAADVMLKHAGTYRNSPSLGQPSLVPSDPDPSVGLNGTSNSVQVPDAPDLRYATNFSLEAWIRPNALPAAGSFASIITKANGYTMQFNGPQLEFTVIQSGTRHRLKAASGAIVAGNAYHVVGTYDGATQRLYINGQQVASAALTGPASSSTDNLYLGSWNGGVEFFNGRLDEAAVFAKALTAAAVSNHYSVGVGTSAPSSYTVTVTKGGTGTGTVTSTPSGISCGSTCAATFSAGQSVTLTATADTGSTFAGWSGACSGTGACTFTVTANTDVSAMFSASSVSGYASAVIADAPVSYWRLNEASGTSAADSVGTHTGTYLNGVALGQPSLLGSDSDPSVKLDGINDAIRVADSTDLRLGASLSLEAWIKPTALPAAGSYASVLTKAESYTLQFNGPQLEFTVIQAGTRHRLKAASGAIVAGNAYHVVGTYDGSTQRLYINGQQVASAALTGPASSTTNNLYLGSWNGSSEFFKGQLDEMAVYASTLSATAVANHYSAGTTSTTSATLASAMTYDAPLASSSTTTVATTPANLLTVTKSGTGDGTVTSDPSGIDCGTACSMPFEPGINVTLTATPDGTSVFSGWSEGPCTGSYSPICSVPMYAATDVTATFEPKADTYPLGVRELGSGTGTVTSSPAGIDCGSTCTANFSADSTVTLTAKAAAGSAFSSWSGACAGVDTTCDVAITNTKYVTAVFVPLLSVDISRFFGRGTGTVTSDPAGISCESTCTATFPAGTTVTLTAEPDPGSTFVRWSRDCGSAGPSCAFQLGKDTKVSVRWGT